MRLHSKFGIAVLIAFLALPSLASDVSSFSLPPLDHGFQLLYNLDFARAHTVFTAWEQSHPDDPMGPTSDAAGLLFGEFQRLGILESQFFVNDKKFNARPRLIPDPGTRARFDGAIQKAERLAHARLAKNPKDKDALFALTLTSGLQGDYAALIEKRNLASLHYTQGRYRMGRSDFGR